MVRRPGIDYDNNSLKKRTWSPEEDQKLIAYIRRYGIWNWTQMAKPAGQILFRIPEEVYDWLF